MPKQRLPQLSRAAKDELPGFRLTQRDIAILESVYTYRALTGEQIEALYFGRSARTQRNTRLKFLYHYGFLKRTEQPQSLTEGRKPYVYWLDTKGAEQLAVTYGCEVGELDWHPRAYSVKAAFLDHLLATNDIRIAVQVACHRHNFVIEDWQDDKTLHQTHAQDRVAVKTAQGTIEQTSMIPDGYFVLNCGAVRYRFFVETDRRTMTGEATVGSRDMLRKYATYLAYFRSDLPEQRYGSRKMRVLTVTTGERRLWNLKALAEKAGGQKRFWFTTFEHIAQGDVLLSPIWFVATVTGPRSLIDTASLATAQGAGE